MLAVTRFKQSLLDLLDLFKVTPLNLFPRLSPLCWTFKALLVLSILIIFRVLLTFRILSSCWVQHILNLVVVRPHLECEQGTDAYLTENLDFAAQLLTDVLTNRQSDAITPDMPAGLTKWLKRCAHLLRCHAYALVFD